MEFRILNILGVNLKLLLAELTFHNEEKEVMHYGAEMQLKQCSQQRSSRSYVIGINNGKLR